MKLEEEGEEDEGEKGPKVEAKVREEKVLIVDRLNSNKDCLSALKELTLDSDGVKTEEFFAEGGQVNHILKLMELRGDKVRSGDVVAVFDASLALVGRVVRSEDPTAAFGGRGLMFAQQLAKRILEDYGKEITLLLSSQNTDIQATTVLRLLTSLVTLGVPVAKLLLVKLDWDNPNWENLPKRVSEEVSPDVRTAYIHFLLSFLIQPTPLILKEYFERKTRLSSIFPGLVTDKVEMVQLVLETARTKILETGAVSKTYKMRAFGAANLKHFINLFNWKGPKVEGEAEDEDKKREDRVEVSNSLAEFLKTLLTSSKHGVIFQDPEFGTEKSLNPLLTELLSSHINKPWENTDIARLVSEILASSPAEITNFLQKLRPDWKPRMSGVWQQLMDLLHLTFSNLDINSMAESFKKTNKVGIHILQNILVPRNLLDEVLLPALASDHPPVSRHALDLLDLVLRNAEQFVKLTARQPIEKEFRFLLKERLPNAEVLTGLWSRELRTPELGHIPKVLSLISFNIRYGSGSGGMVDILQILKDLETLEKSNYQQTTLINADGPARADPRLQTLQIITDLLSTDLHLTTFLTRYVTEEMLKMLVECAAGGSGSKEGKEARAILATIARQANICLEGGEDLDLLLDLALLATNNAKQTDSDKTASAGETVIASVAKVLYTAVNGTDEFQAEANAMQINISQDEAQSLLDSWASPDFTEDPQETEKWSCTGGVSLSPIMLALLEADTAASPGVKEYVQRVLECLVLASKKSEAPLMILLQTKVHIFSGKFIKKMTKHKDLVGWLSEEVARTSPALAKVYMTKLLTGLKKNPTAPAIASLDSFISSVDDQLAGRLVASLLLAEEKLLQEFNPFVTTDTSNLVLNLLRLRDKYGAEAGGSTAAGQLVDQTNQLIKAGNQLTDSEAYSHDCIMQTFRYSPLSCSQLCGLLHSTVQLPATSFTDKSGVLNPAGSVLTALLTSLSSVPTSSTELDWEISVLEKLSNILEFLLGQDGLILKDGPLTSSVLTFLTTHPAVIERLCVNLFYVAVKFLDVAGHRELIALLVKSSARMFQGFMDWFTKLKPSSEDTPSIMLLLTTLSDQGMAGDLCQEKKVGKVLVKFILSTAKLNLSELAESKKSPGFKATVSLLNSVKSSISSQKTLALFQDFYNVEKETVKTLKGETTLSLEDRRTLLKFNSGLMSLLKSSGTMVKKDELTLVLVPAMLLLADILKESKDGSVEVRDICKIGRETAEAQSHSAINTYLVKHKMEWSAFIKGVLKFGLKKAEIGETALPFLAALCRARYFKQQEGDEGDADDNNEMKLIVDMLSSHSGYIPILVGESSELKTSVLNLLYSLTPASCTETQLAPLLSGYTATLHPANRGILKLLCMLEHHGVNVCQQPPLLFGKMAAKLFSSQANSKPSKVSDCLSVFNPDLMNRTISAFPLHLSLDPTTDVEISAEQEALYDPRFMLPYISSLTGPDVYIDRHMKLVESGAISLAVMALSSTQQDMRSIGYHILHRFNERMVESKIVSEKQVWIHLIASIKNGLAAATQNKTCLKLPSVMTLFLARSILILSNPSHHMYTPISNFLLAKPVLNLYSVPEFLRLFHSKEINAKQHQLWILQLLRDGLRTRLDHKMFVQQYVYKLIFSNLHTCLADRSTEDLILEIVERGSRIQGAAFDLVSSQGMLQFLLAISSTITEKKSLVCILRILGNFADELLAAQVKKEDKAKENQEEVMAGSSVLKNVLNAILTRLTVKLKERSDDPDFSSALKSTKTAVSNLLSADQQA